MQGKGKKGGRHWLCRKSLLLRKENRQINFKTLREEKESTQDFSLGYKLVLCREKHISIPLNFELIFWGVSAVLRYLVCWKKSIRTVRSFQNKNRNILFYSNIHTSDTFLSILLTPMYFTFLHGSGCCIRTMPYSNPMNATKIVRVITAPHIHPVALCSYDYQIFHLHRACPNMGLSKTFIETAKFLVATQTQRNKEGIIVKERTRADPQISGLQTGACWKIWLGEKQT